ncbi:MAG: dephospho-CoA kinase [Phycisphaerae bacterium]|nr:dephospho-CoA kinase [Phycisphaerae bacterium]
MSASNSSIPVIGITGGIGSGKSTVAAEFARLGLAIIDADAIGHALLRNEKVRHRIRRRWGDEVFTTAGEVNRTALGEIVFAKPAERQALEDILHPEMRAEIIKRIALAETEGFVAVAVDAAVLFEAGWDDLCSHTVFVDAPLEQRLDRVRASRGWDSQKLQIRQSAQISLDKKAQLCCYTLVNSSDASHLKEQVCRVYHQITRK